MAPRHDEPLKDPTKKAVREEGDEKGLGGGGLECVNETGSVG